MKYSILVSMTLIYALVVLFMPVLADEDVTADWPQDVLDIHHSGLLFDGHNDLPWQMRANAASSFDQVDIAEPTDFHTDIPRLRTGGVKAQFWSVYVPASTDFTGNALIQTLEQIRIVKEMCARYPVTFELATSSDDVNRITASGKIASLIGVEGGHSIQNSLQALRQLYAEGARYMTLTHSKTLAWADSCTDEPRNNGLSPFGKDVVREMNRLGMIVDISHVSPKCMKDALEVSQAPVIFSHSSARGIADHPRNVPDDVLETVKKSGSVVMITFVSAFIVAQKVGGKSNEAYGSVKTVVDHIEHVIDHAGVEHVGIGSDFDGVRRLPVGLKDVSQYPNITQELMSRGYDKKQIHQILGGNVMRVMREVELTAAKLKKERNEVHPAQWKVVVENDGFDRGASVVSVKFAEPSLAKNKSVTLSDADGNQIIGQVSPGGDLVAGDSSAWELTFVVPKMHANQKIEFSIRDSGLNINREFKWHDDGSTQAELQFGDVPVVRYMYEEVDNGSKQRRQETYKPYHHVFSPDGSLLLTKGPGGLFQHHRGIFFGYNRIAYDDKKADTWHCGNGESQIHVALIDRESGPVFGRDTNLIVWNGQDGKPFADEIRQLTVYKINGKTLVEFESLLKSRGSDIVLRGDPQHAGVQFRATQSVPDKTKNKTYYVRPDGKGEPGKFRNWSNKKNETEINKSHINLPWNALHFFVDEQLYSVCYLDHPANPKPARFSERDYGRFGSYFEYDLKPIAPLRLKYRFWVQDEELTMESANQLHRDFSSPLQGQLVNQQ